MKKLYLILGGLSAIALIIYALIPNREFRESLYPISESTIVSTYDDQSDGGTSSAGLSIVDSTLLFKCKLHNNQDKPAWCGLIWDLDPEGKKNYQNWTFVDSLILNISSQNINEIIIKVWTFDPDVTNPEKKNSFRPLIKEWVLKGGVERIAIPMEALYIPTFWYEQNNVDKKLKQKHQETVARFEITPGWNVSRDLEFSISIQSIEVKGLSNLAFGVILFFFLVIVSIAIGFRQKNKK
ncbi:MAG TPA: hypothetical protein PLT31_02625 [Fibrobacteraceae bacterium]|jgi:hypothetical protein|nr:hypothetical protein [Fibrobacter sp.]HPW94062.1 hypothetical protein [Fibrobacteraceae bacterium]